MKQILFITTIILGLSSIQAQTDIQYNITVAQDGSGDFTSVQGAIDAPKSFPPERIVIFVKNGVYNEKVRIHSWITGLSLVGEDVEKTIIIWNDYFDKINRVRN